jgi:hypothetical protein
VKPYLLYREGDRQCPAPANEADLVKDLNLDIIYDAMAHGDEYIRNTVSRIVPRAITDPGLIRYRQEIAKECIQNQYVIEKMYNIAAEAAADTRTYRDFTRPSYSQVVSSSARLRTSAGLLELLVGKFRQLVNAAQETTAFKSEGLVGFCVRTNACVNAGFFDRARKIIAELKTAAESGGMMIGASVGNGLKGTGYRLRRVSGAARGQLGKKRYRIVLKDYLVTSNAKEAEEAGFVHALRAVSYSVSAILTYFDAVRYELAFYLGCANLHRAMVSLGIKSCFPEVSGAEEEKLGFTGLYDLSIALKDRFVPVSNSLELDGKRLIFVTGANQGGKSTFLRSVGIAFALMHCGMQVPAESFAASLSSGIFTHFARAEDADMEHGKLDEELDRMSRIVSALSPHALVLMNEAFATTTEREGALIGTGILSALYDLRVRVVYVTHLYELADTFFIKSLPHAEFLLAQRLDDGNRSFRILPGRPRETSYGEDLYDRIIGAGTVESGRHNKEDNNA